MQYAIYLYSTGLLNIDYGSRDVPNGIIGTVENLPKPLAEAESLEAIIEKAYAHLGRHPGDTLYVADSNCLLYKIMNNGEFLSVQSALTKSVFVAWTSFALCALSTTAVLFLSIGPVGLFFIAFSVFLYLLMVRYSLFNEVEAGAVCVIFTVLLSLLIPAIHTAWTAYLKAG